MSKYTIKELLGVIFLFCKTECMTEAEQVDECESSGCPLFDYRRG